jgi:hypothetical protein
MLATLSKKLIFAANQNVDYTVSTFSQTVVKIDLTKYTAIINENTQENNPGTGIALFLEKRSFPNAQILFNQFVSNPNANSINLYLVALVQFASSGGYITEIGQLQTIPASTNNYLIKDTISLLSLATSIAGGQQSQLDLFFAFPPNIGATALTFNQALYAQSIVQSSIKILI